MRLPRLPKIFKRATEYPASPLTGPDPWLTDLIGGQSSSGVAVNQNTALGYSPIWRSLQVIAGDVASLPVDVFRRSGGGKERATDHAAWRLLRQESSPGVSAYAFQRAMVFTAAFLGNSYALIRRSPRTAEPVSLTILDTESVTPVAMADGSIVYRYDPTGGEKETYEGMDVFHLAGQTVDGRVGLSVLTLAKDTIGIGLAADQFTGSFFEKGAHVKTYLSHPSRMNAKQLQDFREIWRAQFSGTKNAGKTPILMDGMTANVLATSNTESQLQGLRDQQIRAISNLWGVPPHKLGDPTRTSFSSLEEENASYLSQCLDPWLHAFEAEARIKLVSTAERNSESVIVEFNREALVSVDYATKTKGLADLFQRGLITRNEARSRLNMNATDDDGHGNDYLMNLNQVWTSSQPPVDQASARRDAERLRRGLRDVVRSFLVAIGNDLARAEDPGLYVNKHLRDEARGLFDRRVAPVLAIAASITGDAIDVDAARARSFLLVQDAVQGSGRADLDAAVGLVLPTELEGLINVERHDTNAVLATV